MNIIDSITNILRKVERSLKTNNHEPQVERKRDRNGNQYWLVHDARTAKTHTFGSEGDVRVWIENRHHSF